MTDNNLPLYLLAFIGALAITVISEKLLIPALTYKAKQPIYEEGPRWHMSKQGTPTMGGLGFLLSISVMLTMAITYLFSVGELYFAISLSITLAFSVLNSAIGIIDDRTKLKRQKNAGLSARQKLLLQSMLAIFFLFAREALLKDGTAIHFSFGTIDLGILYYPIAFLALVGTVNCANLTDGIDGLATGVAFAAAASLFYISFSANSEVSFICCALMGAAIGFLIFNLHPAKIFMGDTGSLFFGSLIVSCAFSLGNPIIAIFVGIVYLLEGFSVILQVLWFKISGKRIFKMAPLHHHFEKCGWSEDKIVISAIFLTLIAAIPAFIIFV